MKSLLSTETALVNTIRETCVTYRIATLNRHIDACGRLVSDKGIIDVAVLGQFKAGKSSFLNTLFDEPVLPIGAIPVTTVITRISEISAGTKNHAVITFGNGSKIETDLKNLENYITEKNNPGNIKNVHFADIGLLSMNAFPGLRFVDTPGLGSVFKNHGETAENWLPSVGTAIIAISADRPLSENDIVLLHEVMNYTPEIVLLLTKSDLLLPDHRAEVIEYMNETMNRELGRIFPVYLYSAKENTTELKNKICREVLLHLSEGHDETFNSILNHKLVSLSRACTGYLEIALKSSMQNDDDRANLKKMILSEKVSFEMIRKELNMIAREYAQQTRIIIQDHLDSSHRNTLTIKMIGELKSAMPGWKGNLSKFTHAYENWLKEKMKDEIYTISTSDYKKFFRSLDEARTSMQRSVSLFSSQLNRNIGKVLGMSFPENEFYVEIDQPEYPDVKISRSFDFHLDMYWFVIPMLIFRKAFEKHFIKQIPWAVQVNLSRLAYQWQRSLNLTIDSIKDQALQHIKSEIDTIDDLLNQSNGQTSDIKQRIDEIKKLCSETLSAESNLK